MGWIAGMLTVDEGETVVLGEYRDDYRWNGWLVPRMKFDAAEETLRVLAEVAPNDYIIMLDGDDFIVFQADAAAYDAASNWQYEPDVYSPDEAGWYGIGAQSWCWQTVAPSGCDWCGEVGCDYTRHPEALAEVAAWKREAAREEFPFGDHRGVSW